MATAKQLREVNRLSLIRDNVKDLNDKMKSFDNNIKVTGLKHNPKLYYEKEDTMHHTWMKNMLQQILVETGIVDLGFLFDVAPAPTAKSTRTKGAPSVSSEGDTKIKRGLIRAMHPLGRKPNCAIIIAFVETTVKHHVLTMVTNIKENSLELGEIKIEPHLPAILAALRHEAVRERRRLVDSNRDNSIKFVVATQLKSPWVRLLKVIGTTKTPLSFRLDDYRLAKPEIYHAEAFEPLFLLTKRAGKTPAKFTKYSGTMSPAIPISDDTMSGRKRYSWELGESDEEEEAMTMDTE
jgi:hypothetical protein